MYTRTNRGERSEAVTGTPRPSPGVVLSKPYPSPDLVTFPDPTAPPGSSARVFLDPQTFDGFIPAATAQFTDKVRDEGSLREYREAISHRAERARAQLREKTPGFVSTRSRRLDQALQAIPLYPSSRSSPCTRGTTTRRPPGSRRRWRCPGRRACRPRSGPHMTALLGINALRRGEQDNCIGCVGPSSCIFPIAREAVHTQPAGSREAIGWFTAYLDEWPGDLRVRWLLNIAAHDARRVSGQGPPAVPDPARRRSARSSTWAGSRTSRPGSA